eukprot:g78298.t1
MDNRKEKQAPKEEGEEKDVEVAKAEDKSVTKKTTENAEHPLETPWILYYDKKMEHTKKSGGGKKFKQYESNLRPLGTFNTLEGFWKLHSWIVPADNLPQDYNLLLFRHKYIPAWESFPQGGMWIVRVRKGNGVVARLWEELCFAAIAELFEEPDVCGVGISTRQMSDNISVWNKDNQYGDEVRFKIGEKLRMLLNLDESTQVEYKFFNEAIRDGSSFRNTKAFTWRPTHAASAANED